MPDSTTGSTPSTMKKKLKLPNFIYKDAGLWFTLVEQQFTQHDINTDIEKICHITPELDAEILVQCTDLLTNSSLENKYAAIKERILRVYTESGEKKLDKLLSGANINVTKPSAILQHMRRLGGETVTDDILKRIWMRQLPARTREILTINGKLSLEALVEVADKLYELTDINSDAGPSQQIHAVSNPPEKAKTETAPPYVTHAELRELLNNFQDNIFKMIKGARAGSPAQSQISDISDSRSWYGRSWYGGQSRSGFRRKPFVKNGVCTYHFRFGPLARKCLQGCKHATETKKPEN